MKGQHVIIKRSIIVFSILFLIALIGGGLWGYVQIKSAPPLTKNNLVSTSTTKIYDRNDKLLYSTNFQSRDYVKYKDIPKNYINALVSTEDQSFWTNKGINFKSTLLAVAGKLSGGRITTRGGSTITQQLIKLSVFSTSAKDQTIKRKVQEIWLAFQINRLFSKKQILEFYVNKIYEGNNVYGAQTISKLYYNKPLSELNLAQSATIAGLGQSPSQYNLYINPSLVKKRRNQVLLAMYNNKKIDYATYKRTTQVPIKQGLVPQEKAIAKKNKRTMLAQSYIQSVLNEAIANGYQVNKQSYKIYTNYDPDMQQKVTDKLNDSDAFNKYHSPGTQAAATVVNPNNGAVLAQVGGRHVNTLFGINRAIQTTRSTGSSIKPLVDYGPAIEYLGWATDHELNDKPYTYPGTNIKVYDWDHLFMGQMTMRRALQLSRNIPSIEALDTLDGSHRAGEVVRFLSNLGINDKKYYGGSDAIGLNLSTAQMARAFAAIDNGGTYYKYGYIRKVVNANDQVTDTSNIHKRAMKKSTAYLLNSMMASVMTGDGNGAKANINGFPHVAGKDGTVAYDTSVGEWARNAISDSWFVGYTSPDEASDSGLVTAVWCGYDNPNVKGHGFMTTKDGEIATFVWQDIMQELVQGQKNPNWELPSTVQVLSGNPNKNIANTELAPLSANLKQPRTNKTNNLQNDELEYWNQKDVNPNVK